MKLIVKNLKKSYDDLLIFDKMNFDFEAGNVYGFTGENGCGISTLFSCICGAVRPDSGIVEIFVNGKTSRATYTDFAILNDKMILPDYLTGRQFVEHCIDIHSDSATTQEMTADHLLELAGIDQELADDLIKNYTEPEKKSLKLVSIYVTAPFVVLIDDDVTKISMFDWFIDNMKDKHIILMAGNDKLFNKCDEIVTLTKDFGELAE